ncbi:hypothetical protein OESDEN_01356 [Oesophagostomum dentatum]|uniref:Uncharacterized protein n=1 Tax=Oesophagostomum dentatum TaxID=61180 RepID=A0A0B1TN66_OESDE|nr:hypothetical protein OESDEN_01356 [Oesophagostomum dentatum]
MVEKAIGKARKKRASPISASIPNMYGCFLLLVIVVDVIKFFRESTYFLDRIGALKKSLANRNETKTSESVDAAPKAKHENFLAPVHNLSESLQQDCKRLTQPELVAELKQRGTYNPELMAWDAIGVIRFLDRTIHDHYQVREVNAVVNKWIELVISGILSVNLHAVDSERKRLQETLKL